MNGKTVTWKWVATGALTIVGILIAGWVGRVEGFGDKIVALQKESVEQDVTIKHMAKQVDDIHGQLFGR